MINRLHCLALLLAAGCVADPESGIDRTFIRGTVSLPPGSYAEAETAKGENGDAFTAEDLGFITTRYLVVSGTCAEFVNIGGEPGGDLDFYSFSPLKSGTMELTLRYPSIDDTKASDPVFYFFGVYDAAGEALTEGSTQDSFGSYTVTVPVTAGETYTVQVSGLVDREDTGGVYDLIISGFNPNGVVASAGAALEPGWSVQDGEIYTTAPTDFLVGVYESSDPSARGLPVGGSNVPSFELDEETLTWSGAYEVTYVYGATLPEDVDTGEFATPVIDTNLDEVYVFAGTFPSLNASLTAGTFYSSTPLTVSLSSATAEEFEAGAIGVASTNEVVVAEDLACDLVQPKQYGWSEVDTEENDFADSGDGYAIVDLTGAQVMPEATGAGFIDTITGSLDFDTDDPGWSGETDAFAITVPETLDAYMSLAWADTSYNLDFNFYNGAGELIGAGWYVADVNPEAFSAGADLGFYLEPGETYYIGIFGWAGAAGAADYTVEIEWLAP